PAGGGREAPPAGDREAPPHTRERAAPPRPAHHDEEAAVWDLRRRMRRAAAGGLCLWMLTGIVLYSHMVRLHPRYVESFTPPVAAMLGIGLAWATACLRARVGGRGAADGGGADAQLPEEDSRGGRAAGAWARVRVALLALTLAVVVYYSERLLYGVPAVWWVSLAGALAALACVLLARARALPGTLRRVLAPAGAIATSLVAIAAVPLKTDETAIANRVSDAGLVGQIPGDQQRPLSAYLLAHQDGAYYELAAESATAVGSLIVQDAKPVLVLTTYDARVFTSVAKLKRLVAHGKVRYAFLNTFCVHGEAAESVNPACAAPVRWIRAHGTDVSLRAGLAQGGLLYLLPGAKP
ncbi:MAG TPA: hypothetical protein VKV16_00005, partial [Solirubrobacteraceae bacterium]|nr:hypothetical protein [Solirubrobacteraceae bacterium]